MHVKQLELDVRAEALRDLGAEVRDTADPLRRIVAAMLSQPLTPSVGELHFRPLMPVRGTREGQFRESLIGSRLGNG